MTLEPKFVLIKWRDGSTDVWRGVRITAVKTENPDNGEPVEYTTATLPLSKQTERTSPTLLLCGQCPHTVPIHQTSAMAARKEEEHKK